jgi:hypothetical protein
MNEKRQSFYIKIINKKKEIRKVQWLETWTNFYQKINQWLKKESKCYKKTNEETVNKWM